MGEGAEVVMDSGSRTSHRDPRRMHTSSRAAITTIDISPWYFKGPRRFFVCSFVEYSKTILY